MDKVIDIHDISFSYNGCLALDKVSLSLAPGIYGLLGPNGAGKTTLMKVLLGFLSPPAGTGNILGHDIRTESREIRRAVGYMPEVECLLPLLDGVGTVAYLGELSGMTRQEAMKRAHEVLFYVGLEEARYREAKSYSTGMKQRLKMAQALVHDPKLLFLDEPTTGMDPQGRQEILELIRDIAVKKTMSIVFSTHILSDLEQTCEQVVIIDKGRIRTLADIHDMRARNYDTYELKLKGEAEEFFSRLADVGVHRHPIERGVTRIGVPPDFVPADLFRLARDHGLQVRHFRNCKTTLEELFITLIEDNHGHQE
ncbi:MAG: ABC transporter ATP-binding protein [Acidobacteria bacterium]|nr:ABC transporter ATP-binding protein [Acidobacteriota bacterium]